MRPLALLLAGTAALLAGCAATPESTRPQVVASTNVYADIARSIGGDRVDVTAILDDARKDPHEYEATARDRLAVSRADLVIENGGGYDSFLEPLLEERSASAIVFDGEGATWRERRITTTSLARARREGLTAIGSCSFSEPVDELKALGWL